MQEVYSETTESALRGDRIAELNQEKRNFESNKFDLFNLGMCFYFLMPISSREFFNNK